MIPKTIHFCWFGRNEKPTLVKKCIESWKAKCPDYRIIEWNEDNFDITQNTYAREAYTAKKWAFVTDYARLWIIHKYGGIYLDTDVELLKPLDDLLGNSAFLGWEDTGKIATGLGFGAEAGNPVIWCMLQDYMNIHFQNLDGSLDTLPCPVRNTKSVAHLLPEKTNYDKITRIQDATIYPREYFCPLSADGSTMIKTENTYSIHWFTASWLSPDEKIVHDYRVFRGRCEKKLGKKLGSLVARGVYFFLPQKKQVLRRKLIKDETINR